MAILKQNINSEKYYIGWYGTCENPCEDVNVSLSEFRDKIFKIYQTRNDNVGYRSFDGIVQPQLDEFVQHFLNLECGKSYVFYKKSHILQHKNTKYHKTFLLNTK